MKAVKDKLRVSKDKLKAEYTFEDSSKIVRELTITSVEPIVTPMLVIYKYNVKIEEAVGYTGGYFYADFALDNAYHQSTINSIYNSHVNEVGGTYSNKQFYIARKTQINSTPAQANLEWVYNTPVYSGDATISLFVADRNYWSDMWV